MKYARNTYSSLTIAILYRVINVSGGINIGLILNILLVTEALTRFLKLNGFLCESKK